MKRRPRGRAPYGKVWDQRHGYIDGDQQRFRTEYKGCFGRSMSETKALNNSFKIREAKSNLLPEKKDHATNGTNGKQSTDGTHTKQYVEKTRMSYKDTAILHQAQEEEAVAKCPNVYWMDIQLCWHVGTRNETTKAKAAKHVIYEKRKRCYVMKRFTKEDDATLSGDESEHYEVEVEHMRRTVL